jgi:hypothetical protein
MTLWILGKPKAYDITVPNPKASDAGREVATLGTPRPVPRQSGVYVEVPDFKKPRPVRQAGPLGATKPVDVRAKVALAMKAANRKVPLFRQS